MKRRSPWEWEWMSFCGLYFTWWLSFGWYHLEDGLAVFMLGPIGLIFEEIQ